MIGYFKKKLQGDEIETIRKAVIAAANDDDMDEAVSVLKPLEKTLNHQRLSALAIIDIIDRGCLPTKLAMGLFQRIYEFHISDEDVVGEMGRAMEALRDIDDLNAPPPTDQLFDDLVQHLDKLSISNKNSDQEAVLIEGLATTTRLSARQYDELAKQSFERLVELLPEKSWAHYNLGLYFKTRGHFRKGMMANSKAIELTDSPRQAYYWNLGICATGAGEGETALKVWKEQGQKIEMGQFNLPEGGYPSCKVKVATNPLAERNSKTDYPGEEETIWIERLSPCHGIIRSVLYSENVGVNYGDVILFDGAPITYHTYGDDKIAVFPHLATLQKNNYQFFDFAATQASTGIIRGVSEHLGEDVAVYSHTENYHILCNTCWNNEDLQHENHDTEEKHIITGRIAAPPEMAPQTLLAQIDLALKDTPENRIFSPSLCKAANFHDRAKIEQRRFDILKSTGSS